MVLLSISADGDFAMFVSLVEFRLPFPGGDPNFVWCPEHDILQWSKNGDFFI